MHLLRRRYGEAISGTVKPVRGDLSVAAQRRWLNGLNRCFFFEGKRGGEVGKLFNWVKVGKDLKSKKNRGGCRCRNRCSSKMKENQNCLGSFHVYLENRLNGTFLIRFLGILMPSVEGFKYIGVLNTSEVKTEPEIDRCIGVSSAVILLLYRSVVVKKKLNQKAKVSIYRSIYIATLTYGQL